MRVANQLFEDVFWHREVDVTLIIIPLEVDATVEVADAVLNNFVGFRPQGVVEVLESVFLDIFDSKVVNGEIEPERAGFVFPQAWSVGLFVVPVVGEAFLKEFVGKDAGLRETVHSFLNFHVDVTVKCFFL